MTELKTPEYFIENIVAPVCNNDVSITDAFRKIPRALFIDEGMRRKAYEDKALPIGMGQTISQVTTVVTMLHALELSKDDIVLEIGSGSGFVTALLSRLARYVYAVERIPQLMEKSRKIIKSLRITNIKLKMDDGGKGWSEFAPFNKIIVSAGAKKYPDELLNQLADGGILIIPLNDILMKYMKKDGQITQAQIAGVSFVDFVGN